MNVVKPVMLRWGIAVDEAMAVLIQALSGGTFPSMPQVYIS
jgi:hypothetical protein